MKYLLNRIQARVALIEMQPNNKLPSIQFGILKENNSINGLSGSGALNGNE